MASVTFTFPHDVIISEIERAEYVLIPAKGEKGDTGATGADGADGYTPVRGTDYWTEEDEAAVVADAVTALQPTVTAAIAAAKAELASYDTIGPAAAPSTDFGLGGVLMSSVRVAIEPVQDLHGYDNPWPAGGTPQRYDAVSNPVEQGTISATGTTPGTDVSSDYRIRTNGFTPILPSTTYYFSYSGNALQAYVHYYDSQQAFVGNSGGWILKSNTTTFTTPSDAAYVRFVFRIGQNVFKAEFPYCSVRDIINI